MAIKLSREAEYGIIALVDLSHNAEGSERVKVIADRQNIPTRFLEQIFSKLRQANIVEGKRGPSGGYKLTQSPAEITLARIMDALQPNRQSVKDLSRGIIAQAVNSVWSDLEDSFSESLEKLTLEDLKNKSENNDTIS